MHPEAGLGSGTFVLLPEKFVVDEAEKFLE